MILIFFSRFRLQDTGKYCFGVEDTLRALELGSVETLICWENLDIQRYVLKNHATSISTTVLHLTPEQEKDKSHFTDKEVKNENKIVSNLQNLNRIEFSDNLLEWGRNGISGKSTASRMAGEQLQKFWCYIGNYHR